MKILPALALLSLLTPVVRAEGDAPSARALHHDLQVAEQKLVQAKLEQKSHEFSSKTSLAHAATEAELAAARLQHFVKISAPTRRAKAELDLQTATDRATESADELKQIELMYAGQDLNDMTAEFVVARGRRNAERAAARIAIEQKEFEALVNHVLPLEEKQLALDVERKRAGVEKAKLDAESGALGQRIGLMKAEAEIVRLHEKIEKVEKAAAAAKAATEAAPATTTAPAAAGAREW